MKYYTSKSEDSATATIDQDTLSGFHLSLLHKSLKSEYAGMWQGSGIVYWKVFWIIYFPVRKRIRQMRQIRNPTDRSRSHHRL